ncbi:MAG TPA: DNA replication/repair protein RecF [Bacilli bacterium]|nr:DNA replication/repair protein RecF [Bacilli bacterium]HPZ23296.1 DNA replication/repair protein RecF [Bacilli bacterium]HQC83264.1 DNA replication/repair protein RecF [Bacilli bacterium]
MKILNLKLNNFRNYQSLKLNFNQSKNIIIGENGVGKTNIIEAIYVLAFTKSFRGSKEDVIIKYNEDCTNIEGTVKDHYKSKYKVTLTKDGKIVKIDNNKIAKVSDYLSNINIVLFTSEDLKLIKDTPNTRRRLINIELSQLSNDYLKLLSSYNRILKQRNQYLKMLYFNSNISTSFLDILTDKIIDLGLEINKYRLDFINELQPFIEKNYQSIALKPGLKLLYNSDYNNKTKEQLQKEYNKTKDRDMALGKTNIGIHHDDFIFELNGKIMKDFSSEGEQKNAIISLKMAEIDIFEAKKNVTPILILDDLFSELDKKKINNILEFINDDIQTFITTTELNKLSKKIKNGSTIFKIKNGIVKEEKYEK